MKKQIFTLLALLLTVCSGAWADDVIFSMTSVTNGKTSVAKGAKQSITATFNTGSSAEVYNGHGSDAKEMINKNAEINLGGSGASYFHATFTTALAEGDVITSSTENTFYINATSTKGSSVTFPYTIKASDKGLIGATDLYVWKNGGSKFTSFTITRSTTVMVQLSAPEISYDATNGEVTIGSVTNATKVTYTTDGTTPTALSDTYSDSFNVVDGTVVKAIAIGDGENYSNSDVASETVLLTGIKIATPVITKFNGAVAITCASPNATIKYSTNGGATYNDYSRPFTLTADANVLAHAERASCINSDDASENVTVPTTNKTKTIYLDYNDFDIDNNTATGKAGTVANDYKLTIGNASKSWTSNNFTIKTRGGTKREFKLSNGAQNTLTIPDGVHVTKLTIYSIVNKGKASANVSGWKEVGGTDYQTGDNDYKNVPMGAFTDEKEYNTNPDVRVYDIDQTGGTITFTNAGEQLCFVLALDILESTTTITPAKEYVTYVAPTDLDFTSTDKLTAYIATGATASVVTMTPVNKVPAGTPIVLKATETGSGIAVDVATTTDDVSGNKLKVSNGAGAIGGDGVYDYILSDGKFYHASAGVLRPGKAYLHLDAEPGARELSLSFEDGDVTAISNINRETITNNGYFNLAGQRVAQPTKGLYIVNGRKVVVK